MDVATISGPRDHADRRFEEVLAESLDVVLFDVIDEPGLALVGRWIWSRRGDRTVFAVGSSGVEYALTAHWRASCLVPEPGPFRPPGRVERLVVVSGSCSPATCEQIERALSRGFAAVEVDAPKLVDPVLAPEEQATGRPPGEGRAGRRPRRDRLLRDGPGRPPDRGDAEPRGRLERGQAAPGRATRVHPSCTARHLGGAPGGRCGGDTSGQVVRRLGLRAGRRLGGSGCLAASAVLLAATAAVPDRSAAVAFLTAGFGVMNLMLPTAWATCLDLAPRYAGAVTGAINMAAR